MAMKKQMKPAAGLATAKSQVKPGAKDYDTSAHTKRHHEDSKDGQAFGKVNDTAPMDYTRKTNAEGAKSEPVMGIDAPRSMMNAAGKHVGASVPASGAHGFGHAAHMRSGPLRNSGHPGAHRVGKR